MGVRGGGGVGRGDITNKQDRWVVFPAYLYYLTADNKGRLTEGLLCEL